jgi:ADP-dependent NAD(P)H-hydrate dehydratase / NAD(P)H-hydrate epimerase
LSLNFPSKQALLCVDEMYRADSAAMESGASSDTLMENAGGAVAAEISRRWSPRPVVVLCGPGNNGGDGFVVARLLQRQGWRVRVALLGSAETLNGDAKRNAERWAGPIETLAPPCLDGAELIVDALFGAGLKRPITGAPAAVLDAIGDIPVVSIDIPSGLHGDTGVVEGDGAVAWPRLTVTFFRRKPGHILLPGREICGEIVVADIGIPDDVLNAINPRQAANAPELWNAEYPWPKLTDHKYRRGHAVVTGGRHMTGAARMAAMAAQRVGAGIVTVAAPLDAVVVYKITLTTPLINSIRDSAAYMDCVGEPRVSSILVGPGNESIGSTRERALIALRTEKPVVLDADALTVFEDSTSLLYETITGPCVMTPHDGEFSKVFPDLGDIDMRDKIAKVRTAAELSGAVVVLKGADTVVAAPDGRAVVNENAPADLATGGSGDVLSGFITGLLAQGMAPFEASCAGVWLHGAAAFEFGPGLVAEDLINALPSVLRSLKTRKASSQ